MKARIMKAMLLVLISMVGISVQAYDFETTGDPELDYLNVYFKDGTFRIFHFSSLKSLFTSSIDAEGYQHSNNQFQHITTLTDQFVFDLADIDRIEFTKYKEEVVLDNIAKTMEVVLPLVTNCETIADAENIIEEVKQCENVEDAWSDGHEFQVKIKDWETMSFHFNHGVEDEATMAKYKHKIKSGISKIKKNSNINIQRPKVVVANQRDNNLDDKYFTSAITSIVDALKTEGFDAEYVPMPSLDFFYEDMYDYDVVLLTTHGGYSSRRHDFMTGLELGKIKQNSSFPIETAKEMWKGAFNRLFVNPKYSKAQDDIGWTWHEEERNVNGQIEKYWVAYATVFESFFQHTASKKFSNQNSILFNSACMSLKGGNQVADIFMEHRNLGTYLGYDESNYFGPFSGSVFIVNLLTGMSAEKAKEELNNIVLTTQKGDDWTIVNGTYSKEDIDAYNSNGKYIRSYTAELHMLPESNHNRFVTKVCTIEKDNSEINQEYSSNHSVKLEGVAGNRSNEGIKIYYGFEITEYEPITKTWNIDAESTASDGMVEFYANLSNLQPGKTYQYRAYSFDGMNHNFGEPCSFKIPGDETNVTEGLVAYYPFNGNANDASGNGNNGTPSAKVILSEGVNGDSNGAYQFGGYNNPGHIRVPNSESLKFSDGATFSAYFKVTSWTGMDANGNKSNTKGTFCIMAKSHDTRGWTILCSGNDQKLHVEGFNFGGWGSINTDMPGNYLNKWTHVAVVFGNGAARLYVDGQLVKEKETTLEFAKMNGEDLYIGKYSDKWYPFNGVIDEVRIYNRALNDEEIMELSRYSE